VGEFPLAVDAGDVVEIDPILLKVDLRSLLTVGGLSLSLGSAGARLLRMSSVLGGAAIGICGRVEGEARTRYWATQPNIARDVSGVRSPSVSGRGAGMGDRVAEGPPRRGPLDPMGRSRFHLDRVSSPGYQESCHVDPALLSWASDLRDVRSG
jgi:hypothetical protein